MDHWLTTDEIKTATRKRRRLESKLQSSVDPHHTSEESQSPLKIFLPVAAEEALKEMFEQADLDSIAWKRVKAAWYVRVDPELGQAAYDRFISVLHARKVRFEEITEKLFWSSRSIGW